MTWAAALPVKQIGTIVSVAVPAPRGCDLACPYCYIKQREEHATSTALREQDYADFVDGLAVEEPLCAICIQGYEPLLPKSYPYTRAIKRAALQLGLPTSLVTNGTHLTQRVSVFSKLLPAKIVASLNKTEAAVHDRERGNAGAFDDAILGLPTSVVTNGTQVRQHVEALPKPRPARIAVSLDSAQTAAHDKTRGKAGAFEDAIAGLPTSVVTNGTHLRQHVEALLKPRLTRITMSLDSPQAEIHDKARGKVGAFEDAFAGLRYAIGAPVFEKALVVTSVLMPEKHEQLMDMPALLAELGGERWVANALVKVGNVDALGGPVSERNEMLDDLLLLEAEAHQHGIEMTVDNEFNGLSDDDCPFVLIKVEAFRIKRLLRPQGVFRVMPDGRCYFSTDILEADQGEYAALIAW